MDAKYELIKPIGHGAYGVVISALNTETGQKVAIKKITRAFDDLVDAKRILREITLLRKFDHENVSFIFASPLPLSAACLRCPIQRMYVCMHDVYQVRTCCVRAWCFLQERAPCPQTKMHYAWWCSFSFRSPFTRYPWYARYKQAVFIHAIRDHKRYTRISRKKSCIILVYDRTKLQWYVRYFACRPTAATTTSSFRRIE